MRACVRVCVRGRAALASERWKWIHQKMRGEESRTMRWTTGMKNSFGKKMLRPAKHVIMGPGMGRRPWSRSSLLPHFLQTPATPTSITSGFYMVGVFLARGNRRKLFLERTGFAKCCCHGPVFLLTEDCSPLSVITIKPRAKAKTFLME